MIRITKGFFIWYDGRRRRVMRPEDGAFRADDALEARLVDEGVAEYAGEAPKHEPEPEPGQKPEPVEEEDEDLESMTRTELEGICRDMGIPVGKKNKTELIKAIEEAEQAPDLSAAEVE